MKSIKEYVVLAIVVLGLALYLANRKTGRQSYSLPSMPTLSDSAITKIVITHSGTVITITRTKDGWIITPGGYKTGKGKMDNILAKVSSLAVTALISESGFYQRYGLDDKTKISIKAFEGDVVSREFAIGKTASTYRHTFITFPDDPNVYHAQGSLRSIFEISMDDLRDKTALSFDDNGIGDISLFSGDKSLRVTRKKTEREIEGSSNDKSNNLKSVESTITWETDRGEKIGKPDIDNLTLALSQLKLDSYIYDKKKPDYTNPSLGVTLKSSDSEYELKVFGEIGDGSGKHAASSSQNDSMFVLSKQSVNEIEYLISKIVNPGSKK